MAGLGKDFEVLLERCGEGFWRGEKPEETYIRVYVYIYIYMHTLIKNNEKNVLFRGCSRHETDGVYNKMNGQEKQHNRKS